MRYFFAPVLACFALFAFPQKVEKIPFGDFQSWTTRNITESKVIGGQAKTIYAIGANKTLNGPKALVPTPGCPWASSNVYAHVMGINKVSGTVTPCSHQGSTVAKLETRMEHVKALGIVNLDVMVTGTIFLGRMDEPITSTKAPFSKMEMGMPYTKRPRALQFDLQVDMPNVNTRTRSSGLSKQKTLQGRDNAEVYILLQRRWEDAKGNLYAHRVGTGRERYSKSVPWTKGHQLPVHYGDISGQSWFKPWMGLLDGDKAYYARNSKGKLVPVHEVGWDPADASPTHVLVMLSTGCGEAYIGTEGITLYVDNVSFLF